MCPARHVLEPAARIGSKGSVKEAPNVEDHIIPFSGQDDRRPARARKTMQLQDVDAVLRDMR